MSNAPVWRMPAEWAPHQSSWMIWPCRTSLWGEGMAAADAAFAEIANAIARFEPLNMLVSPERMEEALCLLNSEHISVWPFSLNDSWARDVMPLFVQGPQRIGAVNFRFNSWGEKFLPYEDDARLGSWLLRMVPRLLPELEGIELDTVLEGGAIHVDGEGTLMTTEECLLNPNRNPGLSKADYEAIFKQYLGIEKVLWLPYGMAHDADTDGHVDNIACFSRPGTVITHKAGSANSDNAARYAANRAYLEANTDARGRTLTLVEITEPEPMFGVDGERLCPSYINFYQCNGALIVPSFNQPERDQEAQQLLASEFAGRELVIVDACAIVAGGGGIHCITMQQPELSHA